MISGDLLTTGFQFCDTLGATRNRETMAHRVAALFRRRPNEWIDGRELIQVAGSYGWRTRVSDIRRHPFNMRIDNRQRRVGRSTVSEYMLVVTPIADGLA